MDNQEQKISNFKKFGMKGNAKAIRQMYSDEFDRKRRIDETPSYSTNTYVNASAVRTALKNSFTNLDPIRQSSNFYYAINPIYSSLIDYLSNMFMWRYKVTPHKVWTKSKAKANKKTNAQDYLLEYNHMLEVVDGLNIETKFPKLLAQLMLNGVVGFTTICDEESLTIDTIIFPVKYFKKVGETQYGTGIVQFDYSYFDNLGYNNEQLKEFLTSWPEEMQKGYRLYKKNSSNRYQILNPLFSTAIALNEACVPTLFYTIGSILNFEQYQDNELARSENKLKYIVTQKIPLYQDQFILEQDEVSELHRSIRKIIDTSDGRAKLITSYGDINVDQIGGTDSEDNQVLTNAYKSIFNNAGFNDSMFTQSSVTALQLSLAKDRNMIWKYVQDFLNFFQIAINNWFDFKGYEANIDILPISSYTYNDDIKIYKDNATLGIGKIDYIVASGIKQKNIQDMFELEQVLNLKQITPLQTSYTQTAEDRQVNEESTTKSSGDEKTDIEPSEDTKSTQNEEVDNISENE